MTGLQGYGSIFETRSLVKCLIRKEIDTIFIVSPHGYYLNENILFNYIIENSIKVVYIMVDEYAFLGKCTYSNGCTNYLYGCHDCPQKKGYPRSLFFNTAPVIYRMKDVNYKRLKRICFVGPEYTIIQARKSPLMTNMKMEILDEAIDTNFYRPRDTGLLKKELGIKRNQIVLVCVAPFSYERKGCQYFLELAKRFVDDSHYVFIQVGFDIEVNSINLPNNYIPIGYLKDQSKLAEYYSIGDLFVFPSLLDTMPNACLEAMSAGTPLLCFNISGMPYIADETVATFVEPKNIDQMEAVVRNLEPKTNETIKICREYALKRYDNQKYYAKLYNIAESL